MEERVNEKEEIDEEGEEEEKDVARYGSVRSMQCSAVQCSAVQCSRELLACWCSSSRRLSYCIISAPCGTSSMMRTLLATCRLISAHADRTLLCLSETYVYGTVHVNRKNV